MLAASAVVVAVAAHMETGPPGCRPSSQMDLETLELKTLTQLLKSSPVVVVADP